MTLPQATWIDIVVVITVLRMSYIGSRLGVGAQILPFLTLLIRLYAALYCYDIIGIYIAEQTPASASVSNGERLIAGPNFTESSTNSVIILFAFIFIKLAIIFALK